MKGISYNCLKCDSIFFNLFGECVRSCPIFTDPIEENGQKVCKLCHDYGLLYFRGKCLEEGALCPEGFETNGFTCTDKEPQKLDKDRSLIIVMSLAIVGLLVLLIFTILLIFCCAKKNRDESNQRNRNRDSAPQPGVAIVPGNGRHSQKIPITRLDLPTGEQGALSNKPDAEGAPQKGDEKGQEEVQGGAQIEVPTKAFNIPIAQGELHQIGNSLPKKYKPSKSDTKETS